MKLILNKNELSVSPFLFLRQAGYSPNIGRGGKDDSFLRYLGGGRYPCFHIYYEETAEEIIFNLHLDQKRPTYPGAPAHSGEYEGELVEREIARLKNFIQK